MAIQAQHRQLFGRFKFLVDIPGFSSGAFQSCTGLKFNVAVIEYWEGGALAAFKEPGRATFDDIALERGVSFNRNMAPYRLYLGDSGKVVSTITFNSFEGIEDRLVITNTKINCDDLYYEDWFYRLGHLNFVEGKSHKDVSPVTPND